MNKIIEKFEDEIRELKLFKEMQLNENKELKFEIKELKVNNETQINENAELKK